jgi:hypothetical protein
MSKSPEPQVNKVDTTAPPTLPTDKAVQKDSYPERPSILSEYTKKNPNWLARWREKQTYLAYSAGVDGCFAGTTLVHTVDGQAKRTKDIRKGDRVLCNATGTVATILCVLTMPVRSGKRRMVAFANGLLITPMHPILWDGKWALPGRILPEAEAEAAVDRVYNFVVDREEGSVVVNGITCSVLGQRREGSETAHPFWGDKERVVGCLREADGEGWERGSVEVEGTVRDEVGAVYGFRCADGRVVVG